MYEESLQEMRNQRKELEKEQFIARRFKSDTKYEFFLLKSQMRDTGKIRKIL